MPKLSNETQNEHKELVRQLLTMNPRAGVWTIREAIAKEKGYNLDAAYLLKLKKKIYAERKFRFDQALVNERLAIFQEKAEMAQAKLWPIVYSKIATDKNKIAAATAIMRIEKEFLEAQMDAGIFERKLGEVGFNHQLSEEQMGPILRAMRNYGIVLDADAQVIDITPNKINAAENDTGIE